MPEKKPRRSVPASKPGAFSVVEEPDLPPEPSPATVTTPSVDNPNDPKRTPSLGAVSTMEPPSTVDSTSARRSAAEIQASADRAAKNKARRTPGNAAAPNTPPAPKEVMAPTTYPSAAEARRRADPAARARARPSAGAGAPGAHPVAAEEPPTPQTTSTSVTNSDAAAKNRARSSRGTARAFAPGIDVPAAAEEPSSVAGNASTASTREMEDRQAKNRGRRTAAISARNVTQTSKKELSEPPTTDPDAVHPVEPATRTVTAYGQAKPARMETGQVVMPGAVSVQVEAESGLVGAGSVQHVTEGSTAAAFQTAADDMDKKKDENQGALVPGAVATRPGARTHDDAAAAAKNTAVSQPGARPLSAVEAARQRHKTRRAEESRLEHATPEHPTRGVDTTDFLETYDPTKDPEKGREEDPIINEASVGPSVATVSEGIAATPDYVGGQTVYPHNDDELLIAQLIDEDEEAEEYRYILGAIEYDPDAKPPIHKNRRFRLYAITGVLLLLVSVAGALVGTFATRSSPVVLVRDTLEPTATPTMSPSNTLEGKYRRTFSGVVGDEVFQSGTPYYRAATWIIDEDEMKLSPDDSNLVQRYLLALFYFYTTDNERRPWRSCGRPQDPQDYECEFLRFARLADDSVEYQGETAVAWLSSRHECDWVGNLCDDIKITRALELWSQNITGPMPVFLNEFPFLQSIALPYNDFTGTLPPEYADMRHLLNLEVHFNSLSGTIPPIYYESNALQNLNIGSNMFTGSLATEIGQLSSLKGLHIFGNALSSTLPTELGKLEFLSFFRSSENAFTGTIPSEIGELFYLEEFWMHGNLLRGTIPESVKNFESMSDFRVGFNKLTGTVPSSLFNFRFLFRLEVNQNFLSGTIPNEVGEMTSMSILRFARNEFTGTIPTQLASLPSLALVQFQLNQFEGPVPPEFCTIMPFPLRFLNADCLPGDSAPTPCECCTSCCARDTEICRIQD